MQSLPPIGYNNLGLRVPPAYQEALKENQSLTSRRSPKATPSKEWFEKEIKYVFSNTRYGGAKYLRGHLKLVQLDLIAWGCPERMSDIVNAVDKDGKRPLHYAIDWRSPWHINALRKYGATVDQEMLVYAEDHLPPYILKYLTN